MPNMHASTRDMRILGQLRRVIEANGCVPRFDVDVDIEDGVIELMGVMPDEQEHDALLALVASTAPRRPVVDHLVVTKRLRRKQNGRRSVSR